MSHNTLTAPSPNAYRDAKFTENAFDGVRPMGATAEYTAAGGNVLTGYPGELVPYAPASTEVVAAPHQATSTEVAVAGNGVRIEDGHKVIDGDFTPGHAAQAPAEAAKAKNNTEKNADWREAHGFNRDLWEMGDKEFADYLKASTNATDDQIRRSLGLPAAAKKAPEAQAKNEQKAPELEGKKSQLAIEGRKPDAAAGQELVKAGTKDLEVRRAERAALVLSTPDEKLTGADLDYKRLLEVRQKLAEERKALTGVSQEDINARDRRVQKLLAESEAYEKSLEEGRSDMDKLLRAERGHDGPAAEFDARAKLNAMHEAEKGAGATDSVDKIKAEQDAFNSHADKAGLDDHEDMPADIFKGGVESGKDLSGKSAKEALAESMKDDLGKRGGLSKEKAQALKDAQERYTRIAAKRDAKILPASNGRFKKSEVTTTKTKIGKDGKPVTTVSSNAQKGETGRKVMAEAQAELLALRGEAREAKREALKKTGKYSKNQIEKFLRNDDTKFAIKTSKLIRDKEIANFEAKFPEGSRKRKLVQKWKSWGKHELNADGTFQIDPATGERVLKSRGQRFKNFLKRSGVTLAVGAASGVLVASTVGFAAPIVSGGMFAGRKKMTHLTERIDRANARHERLKDYFKNDPTLQATRKTGSPDNYTEAALNETSRDVNAYVTHNRRVMGLGTLAAAAAGEVVGLGFHVVHGGVGHHTNVPHHGATKGHSPEGTPQPPVEHAANTTNINAHPWTVAHNMNALDGVHTNPMTEIHQVIAQQNALGHHYALHTMPNGNQILTEGGHNSAAATHAFNQALVDYINSNAGATN